MKRRLLIGATAVSLMGVLGHGIAGAAPAPKYTIACVVGFNTTAKWQHAKLSRVAFHWTAPAGSSATFPDRTVTIIRKAPHGSAFSTTPPTGDRRRRSRSRCRVVHPRRRLGDGHRRGSLQLSRQFRPQGAGLPG